MITKKYITDELNKFKTYGWDVKTFNYNKRMPSGAVGFVDHILSHSKKGYIIFIEVKIGKDELSKKQIDFRETCLDIEKVNHHFQYYLLDDKNYVNILQRIIEL